MSRRVVVGEQRVLRGEAVDVRRRLAADDAAVLVVLHDDPPDVRGPAARAAEADASGRRRLPRRGRCHGGVGRPPGRAWPRGRAAGPGHRRNTITMRGRPPRWRRRGWIGGRHPQTGRGRSRGSNGGAQRRGRRGRRNRGRRRVRDAATIPMAGSAAASCGARYAANVAVRWKLSR